MTHVWRDCCDPNKPIEHFMEAMIDLMKTFDLICDAPDVSSNSKISEVSNIHIQHFMLIISDIFPPGMYV